MLTYGTNWKAIYLNCIVATESTFNERECAAMKMHAMTALNDTRVSSKQSCSVESCLNQFTAKELLSGNNKFGCTNCTKKKHGKQCRGTLIVIFFGDFCKWYILSDYYFIAIFIIVTS